MCEHGQAELVVENLSQAFTGIYLEQHGLETQNADPFADYMRAGREGSVELQ